MTDDDDDYVCLDVEDDDNNMLCLYLDLCDEEEEFYEVDLHFFFMSFIETLYVFSVD